MKVMSLSQLRANIYRTFFLMRDTGAELEISYRRKIYLLTVAPTGRKVKGGYKRKKVNPLTVSQDKCPECKGMLLNEICMTEKCPKAQVLVGKRY